MNWRAAIYAGIGGGVTATVVQIALWWVFTDALPDILFRDARLAAAIVMGPSALTPVAEFDAVMMLVATFVHFGLSIAYGLILAMMIARLGMAQSLAVGALFGLILFAVNMYGFTALFPWFEATRDPITAAAHAALGVSIAMCYRALTGARPAQF